MTIIGVWTYPKCFETMKMWTSWTGDEPDTHSLKRNLNLNCFNLDYVCFVVTVLLIALLFPSLETKTGNLPK